MKTVILNGSPRKNGDIAFLLNIVRENLKGEVLCYDAFSSKISPCIDCRSCTRKKGCAIKDDMQEIYREVLDCDNLIIASPLYFSELTGPLLNILSRFQILFTAKYFLKDPFEIKPKKGGLIICGGGAGGPESAVNTANMAFKMLNCTDTFSIFSLNTDNVPADRDEKAQKDAEKLSKFLNGNF